MCATLTREFLAHRHDLRTSAPIEYVERLAEALEHGGIWARRRAGTIRIYLGNRGDCTLVGEVLAAFGRSVPTHHEVVFDGPGATVAHTLSATSEQVLRTYLHLASVIGVDGVSGPRPTYADRGLVTWPKPITHAGAGQHEDGYFLAIAERAADVSAWSLIFVVLHPDPDAASDSYGIVVAGARPTYHGGIRGWKLTNDSLHLRFTDEAAAALDVPADLVLPLTLSPRHLKLLERGLHRVL